MCRKILTANSLSSCAILSSLARISLVLGVSVRVSPDREEGPDLTDSGMLESTDTLPGRGQGETYSWLLHVWLSGYMYKYCV